jgi:hypothetical protein
MNTVEVNHPNPTLNLPTRKLYRHKQVAVRLAAPLQSARNIAFSTPHEMFKYAIERVSSKQGIFVVVAWGFVNGKPIDTIGYLCLDEGEYLFTPLNPSREDFKALKKGKSTLDIVHQINDEYSENQSMLKAKRGLFLVDKSDSESLNDQLFDRVASVLTQALYKDPTSMENLYAIAI